ncbi:spore protease YyaC [Domibacillus epiphyticus]|uniref:Spore protease YyaC n=1 Tax=Domibacillus epiphyticus TaxID=1714355 RepID=A0A1V2A614_9BACI|nr:spore protease YyaC [Domibacillus epiphyticus]OMP66459.1 spore protease YyaC [Domibacillus epiphyticus]
MFPFRSRKISKRDEKKLYSIQSNEKVAEEVEGIVYKMTEIFRKHESNDIIILCIGSDLSIGDSLGPLVGTMLKDSQVPYQVYGTLKDPVHAQNLELVLKEINKKFKEPFIFGIDASLGDKSKIGCIILEEGPLLPGRALKKTLPEIGEYHIKAIVNDLNYSSPTKFLENTRLYTVMNMATIIATIILQTAVLRNSPLK